MGVWLNHAKSTKNRILIRATQIHYIRLFRLFLSKKENIWKSVTETDSSSTGAKRQIENIVYQNSEVGFKLYLEHWEFRLFRSSTYVDAYAAAQKSIYPISRNYLNPKIFRIRLNNGPYIVSRNFTWNIIESILEGPLRTSIYDLS